MKRGLAALALLALVSCDTGPKDPWLENARKLESEGNYLGALEYYKKSEAFQKADFDVARRVNQLEQFKPDFDQAREFEIQNEAHPKKILARYEAVFTRHGLTVPAALRGDLERRIAQRSQNADRLLERTLLSVKDKIAQEDYREAAAIAGSFPAGEEEYVTDKAGLASLKNKATNLARFLPDLERAREFQRQNADDPRAIRSRYVALYIQYEIDPPPSLLQRIDHMIREREIRADTALAEAKADFDAKFNAERYVDAQGAVRTFPPALEEYATNKALLKKLRDQAAAMASLQTELDDPREYEAAQPHEPRKVRQRYEAVFSKYELKLPTKLGARLDRLISARVAEGDRVLSEARTSLNKALEAFDYDRVAGLSVPAWVGEYTSLEVDLKRFRDSVEGAKGLLQALAAIPSAAAPRERLRLFDDAHRKSGLPFKPESRVPLVAVVFEELQAAWQRAIEARRYREAVAASKWLTRGDLTLKDFVRIQEEAARLEPHAEALDQAGELGARRKWGAAFAALREHDVAEAGDLREECVRKGSWVAFESLRGDDWDLYQVDPDGSREVRITQGPGSSESPEWSPDGKRIAFVSFRDGNRELYLMNRDGSEIRRLTDHPSPDRFPAWSPRGERLAFVSERDGNPELYVLEIAPGTVKRITNHAAMDGFPSWSPDGERLVFASERDGNTDLYVVGAEGGDARRLTSGDRANSHPAWSPCGKRIAFVSERDGNSEIYLIDADGGNAVRLTRSPAADSYPVWSPDGRGIAFVTDRDGNSEIYVMSPDGGNLRRLTRNTKWDSAPAWSAPRDEE